MQLTDSSTSPKTPRQIRVLCVDDCVEVSNAWTRLITKQSDMVLAGTLERADTLTAVVHSLKPDLVMMDVNLGGHDALSSLEITLKHVPDLRVLIYSGYSGRELVDRCLQLGVWGVVGKHEEPTVVLDAIRRIVNGEAVFPNHES